MLHSQALKPAKLVLEDGTVFDGFSFGAERNVSGEVVFNTGMVGYELSFTDPSYRGQILTLTYPLIGNYGIPSPEKSQGLLQNFESDKIHLSGIIVADYSSRYSHWKAERSLSDWLKEEKIPALTGIDTRALTKKLREKGVMLGKIEISGAGAGTDKTATKFEDPNLRNLVDEVSCKKPIKYGTARKTVALIDCGTKYNIIRSLLKRNVSVLRVPWDYDLAESGNNDKFDAVVITNGPGDPKRTDVTIETAKKIMERNIPTLGICMGNQILALAIGADTYKLKYGHRSQNQPCVVKGTNNCYITSQNHGYAVDIKKLPQGWEEWFVNANDGTNEGIRNLRKNVMSVQFHPEATPGPVDTGFLFDKFLKMVK